ncbi:hypothetical protein Z046_11615 [Pseudomonas aeruginosa VRFPA09]|nr:hypothetical protein Z046_11615 [Pseudomonas aeruginosa VRFPA09]
MEFQVEEHLEALAAQGLDYTRGTTGEEFLADLHPAQFRVQLIGQRQGGLTGGEIQGDDDGGLAGGHGLSRGESKTARIVAESGRLP